MKNKIVFLIATLAALQVFAQSAVDKPQNIVDNGYDHQIVCHAYSENEEYILTINWTKSITNDVSGRAPYVKQIFSYELKNLNTTEVFSKNYDGNVFGRNNSVITKTDDELLFSGAFFIFKRLGSISESTDINLNHSNDIFELLSFKETAIETYSNPDNPIDYCKPATRLCGSSVSKINDKKIVLNLKFNNSVCEVKK